MRTPTRRLSGGQQQMVAMARALASGPRVLLLDEPTEGLQPSLVDRILEAVRELREAGTTLLLVEQKVEAALAVADRIAFIENGQIRANTRRPESLAAGPGAADPLRRGAALGVRIRFSECGTEAHRTMSVTDLRISWAAKRPRCHNLSTRTLENRSMRLSRTSELESILRFHR